MRLGLNADRHYCDGVNVPFSSFLCGGLDRIVG